MNFLETVCAVLLAMYLFITPFNLMVAYACQNANKLFSNLLSEDEDMAGCALLIYALLGPLGTATLTLMYAIFMTRVMMEALDERG